jgi:Thermostable hemolysin
VLTGALLAQTDLRLAARRPARARLEPVHRAHPGRAGFESFIAARFGRAYGAHVTHFLPHLLGVRDGLAHWQAAAGYAAAGVQTLFLEQYLDQPIERAISTALGRPIARPGNGNARAAQFLLTADLARIVVVCRGGGRRG